MNIERLYADSAHLIDEADALIICAGAGMGVDSGLPDFRGSGGFWNAYPALGRARIAFDVIASPQTFLTDPTLAWGFYGHRLKLYRETVPHDGFRMLADMAKTLPLGAFVFTSNVDGHFQRAGFEESRVVECHGSIHHLQCLEPCGDAIWSADSLVPDVDDAQCRLLSELPTCPHCNALARPAILMFGDWQWSGVRARFQSRRFVEWRRTVENPVVIEIGAGTTIPSVRRFAESQRAPIIRINPRESRVSKPGDIAIATGALAGIAGIRDALGRANPDVATS